MILKRQLSEKFHIPDYTESQFIEILKSRARVAIKDWSYDNSITGKIATESKGNLALALNMLKSAALKAESENRSKIEATDIPDIDCPKAGLSHDENLLLKILEEWKSLPAGRLFSFYRERAKHPKEERSFRNYMRELCEKGLVKAEGDKRGRYYEITVGDAGAAG